MSNLGLNYILSVIDSSITVQMWILWPRDHQEIPVFWKLADKFFAAEIEIPTNKIKAKIQLYIYSENFKQKY